MTLVENTNTTGVASLLPVTAGIFRHQSLRYRVNVSISTKGQIVWDCTVDGEGYTQEEILAQSDMLVKELERRYP